MHQDKSFFIFKVNVASDLKQITFSVKFLEMAGFHITNMKVIRVNKKRAGIWYIEKQGAILEEVSSTMSAGDILCVFVQRKDTFPAWEVGRAIMGHWNPEKAGNQYISNEWCDRLKISRQTITLRGQGFHFFSWTPSKNGIHGPSSINDRNREWGLLSEWFSEIDIFLKEWLSGVQFSHKIEHFRAEFAKN